MHSLSRSLISLGFFIQIAGCSNINFPPNRPAESPSETATLELVNVINSIDVKDLKSISNTFGLKPEELDVGFGMPGKLSPIKLGGEMGDISYGKYLPNERQPNPWVQLVISVPDKSICVTENDILSQGYSIRNKILPVFTGAKILTEQSGVGYAFWINEKPNVRFEVSGNGCIGRIKIAD